MARRKRAKRCPHGVSKVDKVTCLMYPRRRGKKKKRRGSSRRAKGPVGSPLYKDVMTYARGGLRHACGSPARQQRFKRSWDYLRRLMGAENAAGIEANKSAARKRAILKTGNAIEKILIDNCFKKRANQSQMTNQMNYAIQPTKHGWE